MYRSDEHIFYSFLKPNIVVLFQGGWQSVVLFWAKVTKPLFPHFQFCPWEVQQAVLSGTTLIDFMSEDQLFPKIFRFSRLKYFMDKIDSLHVGGTHDWRHLRTQSVLADVIEFFQIVDESKRSVLQSSKDRQILLS